MNKSSPFLKCTIAYKYILFILFLFQNIYVYSQKEIPYYTIVQKINAVVIDGLLDDSIWGNVPIITEFKQYDPVYNTSPTKNTAVKLYYTHEAIYIGAIMVDSHPDSIQKQIANRDDDYLNADFFGIQFDTYNNQQDAYTFSVSASGVQSEYRIQDFSYNAVWQSEVKITKNGWSVEIKIPWSALRFPTNADQIWGMQIFRSIRRNREKDLWALEDKSAENNLVYWGKLNGFHQITSPVRLSFVPYFGVFVEHFPHNIKNKSNYSYSINGGLDLKYGINNAYTLDMMLLPDFSQVQSDNLVKNITAFETVYDEKRPFFQEAVDLFSKGDLFYTRRIGSTPLLQIRIALEI